MAAMLLVLLTNRVCVAYGVMWRQILKKGQPIIVTAATRYNNGNT